MPPFAHETPNSAMSPNVKKDEVSCRELNAITHHHETIKISDEESGDGSCECFQFTITSQLLCTITFSMITHYHRLVTSSNKSMFSITKSNDQQNIQPIKCYVQCKNCVN